MAKLTPQQFAEKWARRTQAASAEYTSGIQQVTESPGIAAAAAVDRYQAGIQESIAEGKWQRRVAAVPLSTWKEAAISKGAPRIAQGVAQATTGMAAFASELLPAIDAAVSSLPARGGLEENITRMTEFSRKMAAFRRS